MLSAIGDSGVHPIHLGEVSTNPGISLRNWGKFEPDDLAGIRNKPVENQEDVRKFIVSLFALESRCRTSTQA
jgi:hypothetical protein